MAVRGTPTLGNVLNDAIARAKRTVGTALPGVVTAYDSSSGTCTVKPGVHRLVPSLVAMEDDEVEELPELQDVPVCWLVGRGIKVEASLSPGDTVLLICMERDISAWRSSGEPAEPGDARTHSWGSAVAIPGLVPRASPFPTPSDAAALASKLDSFLQAVSGLTLPTNLGSAITALTGLITAARAVVGGEDGVPGLLSTASEVLKLEG